jgi:hypothetical protein
MDLATWTHFKKCANDPEFDIECDFTEQSNTINLLDLTEVPYKITRLYQRIRGANKHQIAVGVLCLVASNISYQWILNVFA